MNSQIIDIKAGRLFPWQFQLIGGLIIIGGVALVLEKPALSMVLMFAGGFILTAGTGTEIDGAQKRYREYTSFFFLLKKGTWKKFTAAEKVFINSSKVSSQVYTAQTSHSATFTSKEYNGYLKLADGTKLHLLTSRKKEKLATVLQHVARVLKIPVQDNTLA